MSTPATQQTGGVAPAAVAAAPAPAQAEILPQTTTLIHAARLAIQYDKPIQMDYYVDTAINKAFLGEDAETKEKVLVKSKDEFTSNIGRTFKVGEDYLIMTENSIYVVSGKIMKKRISMAALNGEEL
jgi:hypothetical protein